MTQEYGPPIAVNGKRPEWLGDDERFQWQDAKGCLDWETFPHDTSALGFYWDEHVVTIRLRADHPYYQSAEYKASVGDAESRFNSVKVNYSHGGLRVTGELRPDVAIPVFDPRPAMTEAEMIAALEATGHTVTPPDPLAGDREFVAGLMDAMDWPACGTALRRGCEDASIPAAMAYLRANKGRL